MMARGGSGTALNGNGGTISITAGTGGIAALAASNSTAEISTTGASVTLLTAGPIGTSTNRVQFADDSNTGAASSLDRFDDHSACERLPGRPGQPDAG